jgi:hypothetical protein
MANVMWRDAEGNLAESASLIPEGMVLVIHGEWTQLKRFLDITSVAEEHGLTIVQTLHPIPWAQTLNREWFEGVIGEPEEQIAERAKGAYFEIAVGTNVVSAHPCIGDTWSQTLRGLAEVFDIIAPEKVHETMFREFYDLDSVSWIKRASAKKPVGAAS